MKLSVIDTRFLNLQSSSKCLKHALMSITPSWHVTCIIHTIERRYNVNIILANTYDEMSQLACNMVIEQINSKKDTVLGLATGSTPKGLYKHLVHKHQVEKIDFTNVVSFNLDEYCGLNPDDTNSYNYFMKHHLFDHINIKKENVHIPKGDSELLFSECHNYDMKLKNSGGIDLQILGIGRNGHIGFNEPSHCFESRTHVVELASSTLSDNQKLFEDQEKIPRRAITMGMHAILNSGKIILLACGKEKSDAVFNMVHGDISPAVPASLLMLHKDLTLILDHEASSRL